MKVDGKDAKILLNGKPVEGIISIDYRESDEDLKERIKRRLLAPRGSFLREVGNATIDALSLRRAQQDFAKHLERMGAEGVIRVEPMVDKIEFEISVDDKFTDGIRQLFMSDEEVFHARAARAVRDLKRLARRRRMARKRRRGWA